METHCKALLGHAGGRGSKKIEHLDRTKKEDIQRTLLSIFPSFIFKEFFARYGHGNIVVDVNVKSGG